MCTSFTENRGLLLALLLFFLVAHLPSNAQQAHSLRFRDIELRAALDSLLRWYTVPLLYLDKDVVGKRVSAECNECSFEEALDRILVSQELKWKRVGEQVILQRVEKVREAPAATLAGTVTDSLTGEWVAGANVVLRDLRDNAVHRWCSTNQFGFFSLRNIAPGNYTLAISSVGYHQASDFITIASGSSAIFNFTLRGQDVTLSEIIVEGQRSVLAVSEGISRGTYIRATPSDHNQYLLEGARIHNPAHFGGVVSTFNSDALRDVQALAGGVPPYYGGRIGGILDVALRNGSAEAVSGAIGLGSLGSTLVLEGPISAQSTFLVSGRRGYPDLLLPRFNSSMSPSDQHSSEIIAKLSHRLSDNQWLFLSGYVGRDAYDRNAGTRGEYTLDNSLAWGNTTANLRWLGAVSASLFFQASAIYSRYSFDVTQRFTESAFAQMFPSDFVLEDVGLRAHAEHFYDEHHTVVGGVELMHHRMRGTISEFANQLAPTSLGGFSPWELAVYFQDQWRLTPSVSAELGARAASFIGKQGTFTALDPRFAVHTLLGDDVQLFASLNSVNQFVHPYRNTGIFLFYPTIFFYPSTDKIKPTSSLQVSLGAEKAIQDRRYSISAESYYRVTQRLHEFVFDSTRREFADAMIFGEGTSYGAEITITKHASDLTGTLRYSLSWANNRFAELNGGEPFAPRFDRRHELYAQLAYAFAYDWTMGAVCLLTSNHSPDVNTLVTDSGVKLAESRSYYDVNGAQLPGFQRLELNVQHRFALWGLPFQASLRLLNGYGLLDPFTWELRTSPDPRFRWRVKLDAPELFPLYPVVNVSVKL